MQITLYKNFSKRINSTANPMHHSGSAVAGYVKDVKVKSNFGYENQNQSTKCDMMHPSFFLADVEGYVYLKAWEMYYFITNVSYDINGAQYIECEIDVLGTWRDVIMNTRSYVTYSTKIFNKYITDARTAATADITHEVFTDNMTEILSDSQMNYLITVMEYYGSGAGGALSTYFIDLIQLDQLIAALCDDGHTIFGSLTQSITDAMECIRTLRVCPIAKEALPTLSDREIYLGEYATGITATPLDRQFVSDDDGVLYTLHDDYTDIEPYASAKVFLPLVGVVNLPMHTLIGTRSLGYRYYVNVETGKITYILFRGQASPGASAATIIGTYSADFAFEVPLPLSAISNPMGAVLTSVGTGAALVASAVATGGASVAGYGILAGASVTGAGIASASLITDNSIIGTFSGNYGWGACKYVKLEITRHKPNVDADTLKELYGRECRQVCLISDLYDAGSANYCRTDGFSIDISAIKEVKEKINYAMDNGVYLE